MNSANIVIGISHIFSNLLIIAVSIPLIYEMVPMNRLYGFRFKKSYESEENWYRVNKYGGKQLLLWGIALLLLGTITLFLPLKTGGGFVKVVLFSPLLLLIPVFQAYRYARKI